jgi:peptidoglycan/LPS O-acetylase OafA/YrhL
MPARHVVLTTSDASFGVYLSHPIVIQGLGVLTAPFGLLALSKHAPVALDLAVIVLVVVPLVYSLSTLLTVLARRTLLSLVLTGRPRLERQRPNADSPRRHRLHLFVTLGIGS